MIYLDNSATTPVDEKTAQAVKEFSIQNYANPSSQHSQGKKTREKIEQAREKIAKFINAKSEEIIFTSGGTESDNLALEGLAKANPEKKHIITSNIEHPAILETCKQLEKQNYKITYIPVNKNGIINPKDIEKSITDKTLLVSIMHVNNEIGTIQPIEQIGKICKQKNIPFHTDAVQSFAKLNIDVQKQNIDLLSVSGHKINAQKGIGFLYIKSGTKIKPIITGGGQEKDLRSGTENTTGIISLASALDIKRPKQKIKQTRDYLIKQLLKIPKSKINGDIKKRIYNNINISFYGIEGESLLLLLDKAGIQVSTGSACASTKLQESHVLKALKTDPLYTHGSIRITLDTIKPLTKQEVYYIIKNIKQSVIKLRKISPFK